MSDVLVDMRNIRFMLYEVLGIEELTVYPRYADHSRETFDLALDTAYQLAREVFWPNNVAFDREGAQFDGQKVIAPKGMHEIWRLCSEGGWFAPSANYEDGGQQFPLMVYASALFMFNAGNPCAAMYMSGADGAARLIEAFGTTEQKEGLMRRLFSGEWAGTMALTEPDVGTSLGDVTTKAVKAPDGDYYLIKGTKRFISSGDHDLTPNIIHPVLARIEGSPEGVKGLSVLLVPKYRINPDGSLGEFNDVVTAGIEHKMGLKGQATATLNFGANGDCRGWLLGEPDRGIEYMFQLMNLARVYTGIQAVAGASCAYHCALQYTRERIQGRDVTAMKDANAPKVAIIQHPDVRRMLLAQKAIIEGSMGLILWCARKADQMLGIDDQAEKDKLNLLLEVLTPCCKAYVSAKSFESITMAMQCFGGVGYCEDFPVEQLLRDNKVFSIYEGANGVQALDLLGRKVPMKKGGAVRSVMMEITKTLEEAKAFEPLKDITDKLVEVQNQVVGTTMRLAALGMSGQVHQYVCNATAYLEMFSQMAIAWQLLIQAMTAQKALEAGAADETFYRSKIETARFYAHWELPHALATAGILASNEGTALNFNPEWF